MKRMRFISGQWIKYSNKFFPRYMRGHWEVMISEKKFVGFYSFENALIFQ